MRHTIPNNLAIPYHCSNSENLLSLLQLLPNGILYDALKKKTALVDNVMAMNWLL